MRKKMEMQEKFNTRAFVSAGMFISFIGLPFSGYMNHILGFETLIKERHIWMSVHNVLGVIFLIFSIWHMKLNWKPLNNYFRRIKGIIISREVVYAASVVLFFLGLFIFHAAHLPAR
ncbi:MAG: DUF4405 domain-containing protein [Syntrophothermus sp.]